MEFTLGMQIWFNIRKSSNVIHNINRYGEKKIDDYLHKYENTEKPSTNSTHPNKEPKKIGIDGCFLNMVNNYTIGIKPASYLTGKHEWHFY